MTPEKASALDKTSTQNQQLVLIGGGHTHALALKDWGLDPLPDIDITVINPTPRAAYSGMLPGFISGHYARKELEFNIEALAAFAGANCVIDSAVHIDTENRLVHLNSGKTIGYDYLSIDIGITCEIDTLKGFSAHGVSAKPLGEFARAWQSFMDDVLCGKLPPEVAIIGGGVAGAELALAMAHALRGQRDSQVTLIDRSDMLEEVDLRARTIVLKALNKYRIHLKPHTDVEQIHANGLVVSPQDQPKQHLTSHFTLSAAGATPYKWLENSSGSGAQLHLHEGFISVDRHLRSSNNRIFAVGDCAHMTEDPRSKAGVYAVRQAPVLFANLRCVLSNPQQKLSVYTPQKDYLKLVSLGSKRAVANKNGFSISGTLAWKWKNRIDQSFMKQFRDL